MISAELVGSTIAELRKSKGMSQEVLSGLAGLDRTHYSKIERGLRSPTIDTLFKIAHALDMPRMRLWRPLSGHWLGNWPWFKPRHTNRGPGEFLDPDSLT